MAGNQSHTAKPPKRRGWNIAGLVLTALNWSVCVWILLCPRPDWVELHLDQISWVLHGPYLLVVWLFGVANSGLSNLEILLVIFLNGAIWGYGLAFLWHSGRLLLRKIREASRRRRGLCW